MLGVQTYHSNGSTPVGAPLYSQLLYGLVANFPSCSRPQSIVVVVAHVFEQRLTRLACVLVRVS